MLALGKVLDSSSIDYNDGLTACMYGYTSISLALRMFISRKNGVKNQFVGSKVAGLLVA